MKTINLTKVYNPLNRSDQDICQWEYQPEDTVAELISSVKDQIGGCELVTLAVSVNGIHLPEEKWHELRLAHGQYITIIPVIHGGGGGKDVARMIGMVVLMVAVMAFAGPLAAGLANAGFFGTSATALATALGGATWMSAAVGAIMMTAGSLLLNAALPATRPPNPSAGGYVGMDESNSYSWNPSTTQQQGAVIPWHYGTCKVTGNVIGVYRENVGLTQYLNILISLGEGILSPLYDIKINGQLYTKYNGVTIYSKLGEINQDIIPNFGDTRIEFPLNISASKPAVWSATKEYFIGDQVTYTKDNLITWQAVSGSTGVTPVEGGYWTQIATPQVLYTTTETNFDSLEIVVGCPNGVGHYTDTGAIENFIINFKVEYKKSTDIAWTLLSQTATETIPSATGYWSLGYWQQYTTSDPDGYIYTTTSEWVQVSTGGNVYTDHHEGEISGNNTYRWLGASIPLVDTLVDYTQIREKRKGPVKFTYRVNNLLDGTYDIRVARLTPHEDDSRYMNDLYLLSVTTMIMDDFTYPGEALIGIRALATDQLSGSFSFEAKTAGKLCRVYRSGSWYIEATSNPAWVTFDILTQPIILNNRTIHSYRAHDPSRLDLNKFIEWAVYCNDLVPDGKGGTEPRLTWNGQFDSSKSMWDAAIMVAKIGRAVPYWRGNTISLAIDKPESPCALISVGNIGLDSFEETFLPMDSRAGKVDADFINSENGYERDKVTVLNGNAPASWGSAPIALQGVIKPSEAYRHCMYYLNTTQNLTRVVSVNMDVDAIAFTLGSVINVQHDVPMWGEGGRIVSATTTQVVLDKQITLEVGETYNIMLRLLDGTIAERTVSTAPSTTNTITVSTPFASAPAPYDVYAIGKSAIYVKPMRVNNIVPSGDLKRKIVLTDYNATVWNGDTGEPVIRTTNYTDYDLTTVTGLTVSEHLVLGVGGTIGVALDIHWNPITDSFTRYVEILMNGKIVGKFDSASDTSINITDADGSLIFIQARTISWLGKIQSLELATSTYYSVIGKAAPPADVPWCVVQGRRVDFGVVTDLDLSGYEVRYQSGYLVRWDTASKAHDGLTNSPFFMPPLPPNNYTVMVKAVDTTGNYSLNPVFGLATYVDSTLLGDRPVANVVETFDRAAENWPGTLNSGTRSAGDIVASNGGLFWASDAYDMWSYNAGDLMFAGSYNDMVYIDSITITTALQNAQMTIDTDLSGNFPSVSYRLSGHLQMWSAQPNDQMWSGDAAGLWTTTEYMPWPGAVNTQSGTYDFRLSTGSGPIEGRATTLIITIDVPDIDEYLKDVNISALGTRLALNKTYNTIKTCIITMQSDGGTAVRASVIDKSTAGPLIETYNGAGTKVTGRIDAHIQGY